jgi:hypothetical protein
MTDEDKADIPHAWHQILHPRRHGTIGLEPARDGAGRPGQHSGSANWGTDLADEHERILRHSRLDPALARLVRTGHPDVAADAVRLALAPVPARGSQSWELSVEQVDELVASRGLAHAAAAFVESCAYDLAPQHVYDEAVAALTPLRGGLLRLRIAASYLMPDRHD